MHDLAPQIGMATIASGSRHKPASKNFAFRAAHRYRVGHRRTAVSVICGANTDTRAKNES
jgi:hypothetical protein